MRIYNVSSTTSMRSIVLNSLALLATVVILILMHITAYLDALLFPSAAFILPYCFVIFFIYNIVYCVKDRNTFLEIAKLKNPIKYVDFQKNEIFFYFIDSQYNTSYSYRDIKDLKMHLSLMITTYRGTKSTIVKEINLNFTTYNNKTFKIATTPLRPIPFIAKVINYTRDVQNFSYKIFQLGNPNNEYKEVIEYCLNTGCKPILSTTQENANKKLSICFCILNIVFILAFAPMAIDTIRENSIDELVIFSPFSVFFILLLIIQVLLICNRIRDKKFEIVRKRNNLVSKIPSEILVFGEVLIQLIVVLLVIKFC